MDRIEISEALCGPVMAGDGVFFFCEFTLW
jgi:hypothetical protein